MHIKIIFKWCVMQLNVQLKKASLKLQNKVEQFYEPDEEGVYNISLSGDGTSRKRGFSSSFGVVTVCPLSL